MGTKYKGSEDDISTLNAYIAFARASESLTSRLSLLMADYGLTMSQFGILEVIYHLGPICQKELGAKLLKSTANITTVLDNLEKKSLVIRKRETGDKRYILVYLTPEGKGLISKLFPIHLKEIKKEFNILTKDEKKSLKTICKILGKQERD